MRGDDVAHVADGPAFGVNEAHCLLAPGVPRCGEAGDAGHDFVLAAIGLQPLSDFRGHMRGKVGKAHGGAPGDGVVNLLLLGVDFGIGEREDRIVRIAVRRQACEGGGVVEVQVRKDNRGNVLGVAVDLLERINDGAGRAVWAELLGEVALVLFRRLIPQAHFEEDEFAVWCFEQERVLLEGHAVHVVDGAWAGLWEPSGPHDFGQEGEHVARVKAENAVTEECGGVGCGLGLHEGSVIDVNQ